MSSFRHPLPVPQAPCLDGPVLLKDGRPAYLRRARMSDLPAVQKLLERTSDTARLFRFFHGVAADNPEAAGRLIAAGNEQPGLTLVITVGPPPDPEIAAVASYSPTRSGTAEVAFLVADAHHGRGMGTLLLERLAMHALEQGLDALEAFVMGENREMLAVFAASGFTVRRKFAAEGWHIVLPLAVTEAGVRQMEVRDRLATRASLYPFFHPRAVAVVGSFDTPSSWGHRIVTNLIQSGFHGAVYPVGSGFLSGSSVPAYPSVLDVPGPVDLAMVSVPATEVMDVARQCAETGVRALLVATAGFGETGPEGAALERKLVEFVRGSGMRLIGPNSLGLIHTDPAVRLHASPVPAPPAGRIALSSQSAALGSAALEYGAELGLGFSAFVSVGNKADVSGNDLLQWWEEDDNTAAILLYLESFGNPRRFARLARRVSRRKPIVALKGGRSRKVSERHGAGPGRSNIAALAAEDRVVDALFRQAGVIRTRTLSEMFDIAALLARQPLPRGRRVAVLGNARGPAVLCAGTLEQEGLTLSPSPDDVRAALAAFLPPGAEVANPVDMSPSASADDYRRSLEVLAASDAWDAVIAIFAPGGGQTAEAVAQAIAGACRAAPEKPVLACFMTSRPLSSKQLSELPFPVYRFPEAAAMALSRIARYAEWRQAPAGQIPELPGIDGARGRTIARAAASRGGGWLPPSLVHELLDAFGLPRPASGLACDEDEAVRLAEQIGYPVAVKPALAEPAQKAEWNGVHLNIRDAGRVRAAVASVRKAAVHTGAARPDGGTARPALALVQAMAPEGIDTLAGVVQDETFGPILAFGLAGTAVEALGDVAFRITPLTDRDATEMVEGIRGRQLLDAFRGRPASDVRAACEVLLRLSRMIEEIPGIAEVELNPVRLLPAGQGALVLDARIRVK